MGSTHTPRLEDLACQAVLRCLAVTSGLITDGLTEGRLGFHVVVGIRMESGALKVLQEHSVGKPADWRAPFDEIARSKATISAREGKPTVEVPMVERLPGDTQYWGSVVAEDNVVVAVSGLQPWFDELTSWLIEATMVGLMKHYELIYRGPEPDRSKPDFLTEEYVAELRASAGLPVA